VTDPFEAWVNAVESRQLTDLQFSEVARALRALSATYVQKRSSIGRGAALSGHGKRAAFALFFAPLHYLLIRHIVNALQPARARSPQLIVDLGCGTGAGGAAWAIAGRPMPKVFGIDRHPWALREAGATYRAFGIRSRTIQGDVSTAEWPRKDAGFLAAFVANELDADSRHQLLDRLLERARAGCPVLVVEPLAGFVAPWWPEWQKRFEADGGRADEWRFHPPDVPAIVAKLDRAAGLDHRELTGRSLWLKGAQ
jgi:SAM-dependent methyltransferase